jgi:hypothetical protein
MKIRIGHEHVFFKIIRNRYTNDLRSTRVAKVRFSLKNGFISQTCSKPAENLFSREKPAEMGSKPGFLLDLVYEGLDKRCKPGLSTNTYQKPALNKV